MMRYTVWLASCAVIALLVLTPGCVDGTTGMMKSDADVGALDAAPADASRDAPADARRTGDGGRRSDAGGGDGDGGIGDDGGLPDGGGGSGATHEPAGLTTYVDFDYSTMPPHRGNEHLMRLVSDDGGSRSPGGYLRHIIPDGATAGRGGYPRHAWSETHGDFPQLRRLYVALWVRFPAETSECGTGWEQQATGTKLIYMLYGFRSGGVSANFIRSASDSVECSGGGRLQTDDMPYAHNFKYAWDGSPTRRYYAEHTDGSWFWGGSLPLDRWVRLEWLYELNEAAEMDGDGNVISGAADGVYRFWVEDELRTDRNDILYATTTDGLGFYEVKMANIWGGTSGTKTRADYIDYDHVYIAGEPL